MGQTIVAGATGTLGRALVRALSARGERVVALARASSCAKLDELGVDEVRVVDVARASDAELGEALRGGERVISTVGITRQRDGLTPRDVDLRVNVRLARAAQQQGVARFGYVSVATEAPAGVSPLIDAKRAFEEHLSSTSLAWTIYRPSGFMSDFAEVLDMARGGAVYLFGDGRAATTPIDVDDLAGAIAARLDRARAVVPIGGPETMTWNEVAQVAFEVLGRRPTIRHVPLGVVGLALGMMRVAAPASHVQWSFLSSAAMYSTRADELGERTLASFFASRRGG